MIPFLKPDIEVYTYNIPKEIVVDRILRISKEKINFFSERDVTISFINDKTFVLNMISVGISRPKTTSVLICSINVEQNYPVVIKTKVKRNPVAYIISFIVILIGLGCLVNAIKNAELGNIFGSLCIIIGIPFFMIAIGNASGAAVRRRYNMYIDKPLRSLENATF